MIFFPSLQSRSFTKEGIKHKVMTKPFIHPSIFLTAYYMKKNHIKVIQAELMWVSQVLL